MSHTWLWEWRWRYLDNLWRVSIDKISLTNFLSFAPTGEWEIETFLLLSLFVLPLARTTTNPTPSANMKSKLENLELMITTQRMEYESRPWNFGRGVGWRWEYLVAEALATGTGENIFKIFFPSPRKIPNFLVLSCRLQWEWRRVWQRDSQSEIEKTNQQVRCAHISDGDSDFSATSYINSKLGCYVTQMMLARAARIQSIYYVVYIRELKASHRYLAFNNRYV